MKIGFLDPSDVTGRIFFISERTEMAQRKRMTHSYKTISLSASL